MPKALHRKTHPTDPIMNRHVLRVFYREQSYTVFGGSARYARALPELRLSTNHMWTSQCRYNPWPRCFSPACVSRCVEGPSPRGIHTTKAYTDEGGPCKRQLDFIATGHEKNSGAFQFCRSRDFVADDTTGRQD